MNWLLVLTTVRKDVAFTTAAYCKDVLSWLKYEQCQKHFNDRTIEQLLIGTELKKKQC